MKTWLITGAGRGLGLYLAKAALAAGDRVVATSRKRVSVDEGLGVENERLLPVALDVSDSDQARAAVAAAVAKFGGIDVLVNNAGYGQLGFFEETTLANAQAQFSTNLFGAFQVTWAALPAMRAARKGRIFNLSSIGGLVGGEFASLYCASKFALEGFSGSLAKEVAPFGLWVTIVEPGPFRTDFLTSESLHFTDHAVADYQDRRAQLQGSFKQRNGQQPGDPAKLANAMIRLADVPQPPLRFIAGSIAVAAAEAKLSGLRAELDSWRELSLSTDGNYGAGT